MKFTTLDLNEKMLQGIEDAGFEKCTPVQEQALPEAIKGRDIIVQSQTGTGKTAVFITTIYNRFIEAGKERPDGARALVMAPTRELAVQIDTEAKKLATHLMFRSIAIYGGVEYEKQISALKKGVDLVVATPGRMIDLYKSKSLSLNDIEIFVVDEADRMFDMGFAPDISYIASRLPKGKERQTMLFSATIDENVHRLASRYMKPEPVVVEIEPEQVTVDKIDQKVLYPSNKEKLVMLMALLRRPDVERAIIFCNMKRTVEMLEWKLSQNGFLAMGLTGDVTQSKRQRIIDDMKAGKLKILVATDVVARGLHVEDITHVYNYDLPQEAASYVHRIGRTARAGKSGKAYSLVCEDHAFNLPEIEKYIERKIPAEWIDEDEMLEDKAGSYRSRAPRSGPKGSAGKGGQGQGRSQRTTGSARGGSHKTTGVRGARKPGGPAGSSTGSKEGSSARGGKSAGSTSTSRPARSKQERGNQEKTSQDKIKTDGGAGEAPKGTEDTGRTKRPRRSRGRGRGLKAGNDNNGSDNKEKVRGPGVAGGNGEPRGEAGRRSRSSGGTSVVSSVSPDSTSDSASSRTARAPSKGSRGRPRKVKAKAEERSQGTRSRTTRAGTGASGSGSETGGSIGNALIESQTGGAVAGSGLASSSGATGVKPKKGVLKRILNVFGRK